MTITITGIDDLLEKLDRLDRMDAVRAALEAAAEYLKGKLATYPPQRVGLTREEVYGVPFLSDLQRRFFFWALGAGEIEVPYHRGEAATSERLGQSWTIDELSGGLTQVIGNDTSYGTLVMGSYDQGEQAEFMHQMGWTPADVIADEYEDQIVEWVTEAIQKECDA